MKQQVITRLVLGLILTACTTTPYVPETYYRCYDQNRWSDAGHEYVITITRFVDPDGSITFDSSGLHIVYKINGDKFNISPGRLKTESSYANHSLTADLRYMTKGLPAKSHIDIEFPNGVAFRSGPSLEKYGYSPNFTANWMVFKTEMNRYNSAQLITRNPKEEIVDQRDLSLVPLKIATNKYQKMDKEMDRRLLTFATSCTLQTVDVIIPT